MGLWWGIWLYNMTTNFDEHWLMVIINGEYIQFKPRNHGDIVSAWLMILSILCDFMWTYWDIINIVGIIKRVPPIGAFEADDMNQTSRLDCVLGSLLNCMWCIVMLIFVMYIFALLVQQTLVGFLQEEGDERTPEEIGLLYQYFGSVQITLITLFQAITSGVDWHVPYEVLLISGSILPAAFVFYVAFVFISVWNIAPWLWSGVVFRRTWVALRFKVCFNSWKKTSVYEYGDPIFMLITEFTSIRGKKNTMKTQSSRGSHGMYSGWCREGVVHEAWTPTSEAARSCGSSDHQFPSVICVYENIQTYIYVCIYILYTYMYVCMYACMYVCIYILGIILCIVTLVLHNI